MSRFIRKKLFAIGCTVLILSMTARGTWAEPVTTIRNNGDSANRVDFVIMGDGYTVEELAKYQADVEAFVQGMFSQEPFKEYQRYFNVHRVDVTSNESGADHPERSPPVFKGTALGAAYNCAGIQRLICVDVSNVNAVLSRSVPPDQREVVLVIVNDPEYGGSGGAVAVASVDPAVVELILHELGHSFGLLADEYGGPPPPACNSSFEPPQMNATKETVREQIKWRNWISPSTPIPTSGSQPEVPGLYEGAIYCDTGLFRPTFNSKMRSLFQPYEQINSEQLVKRIYNWVSPIDSTEPIFTAVTLARGSSNTFRVHVPQPFGHTLDATWKVNGLIVATGEEFTLNSSGLAIGLHSVEVAVTDSTQFVRIDPDQALRESRTWNLTVVAEAAPAVSINNVTLNEANVGTTAFVFTVSLSAASTQPITVTYSTANRTATGGIDYVSASGILTFDPGETTKTIIVVVNANAVLELNKSFLVNLTSATNAIIFDGEGVGTIINDDGVPPERLSNISTRGGVLTGDNVMIGGFIIDGSASKRVLVRSRGPSMSGAPFFVPGTLANPLVRLFSGSTVIAQNDNWQDAPSCSGFVCEGAAAITASGLDPCTPNPGQAGPPPSCNLEAAILITLPPGAYTAIVTGADGGTGVGLVEVFEADASTLSELSNISTRGFVQSGDNVMIGGVIIEGSVPATVLIRARGPSMSGAPFFVPGTLANPFIQLFSGQTVIAQNDNWQDAPNCTSFSCGVAAQIAATGLDPCQPNPGQSTSPPGCVQESAMLITLPPGAYTAIVSGVGGVTGVGIVEVFEVN
jgi:hypothetical protein